MAHIIDITKRIPQPDEKSYLSESESLDFVKPEILLVDDDKDFVDLIGYGLDDKFNILTANDGRKALKLFKQHSPELVITDIFMPKMNGIDLIVELNKYGNVPVVAISGYEILEHSYASSVISSGTSQFIQKPCSAVEVSDIAKIIIFGQDKAT